jgi:carbonic anhydrase/acetyltransferase-like protein (isoleucine patch superfamily)
MLLEHDGIRPRVEASAYVAPNATVSGDVTIGADCRVLFGAVVSADGGPVELGKRCIVMEHAPIRGRQEHPTRIGANVLIGPFAHVNGATIEDNAFVATGASVFPGSRIGSAAEIRIHGVVHVNSVFPARTIVPIRWVAVGDPAELFPPEAHERIWTVQERLDFPRTVFGLRRASSEGTIMPEAMERYAELFGRHRRDRILGEPDA